MKCYFHCYKQKREQQWVVQLIKIYIFCCWMGKKGSTKENSKAPEKSIRIWFYIIFLLFFFFLIESFLSPLFHCYNFYFWFGLIVVVVIFWRQLIPLTSYLCTQMFTKSLSSLQWSMEIMSNPPTNQFDIFGTKINLLLGLFINSFDFIWIRYSIESAVIL